MKLKQNMIVVAIMLLTLGLNSCAKQSCPICEMPIRPDPPKIVEELKRSPRQPMPRELENIMEYIETLEAQFVD